MAGPPLVPSRATRLLAAVLSLVEAPLFLWAGYVLPWTLDQAFSVLCFTLGAAHLAVVLTGLAGARSFARTWRMQAVFGFAFALYCAWIVGSSASYMVGTYRSLGAGLGAALLVAYAPVVLLTVPSGLWAFTATGGVSARGAGLVLALLSAGAIEEHLRWRMVGAGETQVADAGVERFLTALEAGGPRASAAALEAPRGSLMTEAPAACPSGQVQGVLTWLEDGVQTECLTAPDVLSLADQINDKLSATLSPAKLDLLVATQSLDRLAPLVSPFVIRPGLDGICSGGQCLMPWQLVTQDRLNAFQPLSFIPDLRLGVDPAALRAALGVREGEGFAGLERVETASLLRDEAGRWTRLERMRPLRQEADPTAERVASAAAGASRFVHSAQLSDGRFIYLMDPYHGTVQSDRFSVARQAGTTLALCELGDRGEQTLEAAKKSLGLMRRLAVPAEARPELAAISWPPGHRHDTQRLGPTALSVIAMATCRLNLGITDEDETLARAAELVLSLAGPEGRFHPKLDMRTGEAIPGPFALYADGQGIYALVLLEQIAAADPAALPHPAETYREAAEAAMRYYGETYWQMAMRDFFFIEENWHCLAARAALPSHRNEAYEDLCLDYIQFKARLVLDAGDDVRSDVIGGYHWSNVTPPYNTPTAGYGEAASAALAVAKARGLELPRVRAALERALGFLVHAQHSEQSCFACSDKVPEVAGAFSESLGSPIVRIDYVQHAWAALGHGGRALGWM